MADPPSSSPSDSELAATCHTRPVDGSCSFAGEPARGPAACVRAGPGDARLDAAATEAPWMLLPDALWISIACMATGRDAAALSCAHPRLRHVFAGAWAAGAFQPVERSRGSRRACSDSAGPAAAVRTLASCCFELSPGANLQRAIEACPAGGAVRLMPGTHLLTATLRLEKSVHVFGSGRSPHQAAATVLKLTGEALLGGDSTIVHASEAAHATLDGVVLAPGAWEGLSIRGRLRVQHCSVAAERIGIAVEGPAAFAMLLDTEVVGPPDRGEGTAGISFVDGAKGFVARCSASQWGADLSALDSADTSGAAWPRGAGHGLYNAGESASLIWKSAADPDRAARSLG